MEFFMKAEKVFDLDEGNGPPGKYGRPYKDSNGYWTIGKGHLIGEELEDMCLSPAMVREQFREDLAIAIREARFVVGTIFYDSLSDARKMALTSLLYTLGRNKFLSFDETIDAIKREDWNEVARRILLTKWARDVDPHQRKDEGRDDRIAYMFRTGEFHPDYKITKMENV